MRMEAFGLSEPGSSREVNADQYLVANLTKAMNVVHTSLEVEALRPVVDLEGHLLAVAPRSVVFGTATARAHLPPRFSQDTCYTRFRGS